MSTQIHKSFHKFLYVNVSNKLISFLNIERDSKRPRKDIATYKDIKTESAYIFNDLFYKDRNETYKDIDEKIDYDVINKYIEIYRDFNSEDDWYNQIKVLAEEMGYAPSVKMYKEDPALYKGHIGDYSQIVESIYDGKLYVILEEYMNLFQTLVFVSFLFCLISRRKKWTMEQLFIPLVLLGGFFFHIIWEAKSQYIFPYFVSMLPIAAMGLAEAVETLERIRQRRSLKKNAEEQ